MNGLTDKSELEKAKETVRQYEDDYYLHCAKDGSKWHFVNYAYIPSGFQCEWCGNTNGPPKHAYFIENENTGERKVIGSVCIDNVMKLGGAYNKFEKFKQKIDKLQELKDMERSEFIDSVAEVTGKKDKIMLEIQDLDEAIEEEKEKKKQERRERIKKQRKEKKKKIQEQDDWLEDNDLKRIKYHSSFTMSVLDQHEKDKELSERQKSALLNVKDEIVDDYGSVDNWEDKVQEEKKVMEALENLQVSRRSLWDKHVEVVGSLISQYKNKDNRPRLSDKQVEYAKSILDHYSVEWKDDGGENSV